MSSIANEELTDGNGEGVFILQSQKYESHQPEELVVESSSDCEMVRSM